MGAHQLRCVTLGGRVVTIVVGRGTVVVVKVVGAGTVVKVVVCGMVVVIMVVGVGVGRRYQAAPKAAPAAITMTATMAIACVLVRPLLD